MTCEIMASSPNAQPDTIVVDSVHGDIRLTPRERRIIDTASFQRLRHLKQLGMGQVTYPNATHSRFAHSLGVLGVMRRVTRVAREPLRLSDEDMEDVCLAGLLHDIGHYPYSHLMEKIDHVTLTEEFIEGGKSIELDTVAYPDHEAVGGMIVTGQRDLITAIGSKARAQEIAKLFRGEAVGREQLAKLIHSSLDMDRLDYLLRDAKATGVPYGRIDLNYLLNNMRTSPSGMLGVDAKALPAAEQCLFARFFMYRTVYFHKTTFGLEEACRQLLRRLRDLETRGLARDGNAIRKIATTKMLGKFTDAYVDSLINTASGKKDSLIQTLANAIRHRRPPKLLKEVCILAERETKHHAGTTFRQNCRHRLAALASEFDVPLGCFLVCDTPPKTIEQRGGRLSESQARGLKPQEKEEVIKVFQPGQAEPVSLVSVTHSLASICSNHFFQAFRLYLVRDDKTDEGTVDRICDTVANWDQP
ncbi:MAG: HD domain-containing protein [bacterium]|nr:HD domain-containing protein [bacterium]